MNQLRWSEAAPPLRHGVKEGGGEDKNSQGSREQVKGPVAGKKSTK